jgi:hypothetical protein
MMEGEASDVLADGVESALVAGDQVGIEVRGFERQAVHRRGLAEQVIEGGSVVRFHLAAVVVRRGVTQPLGIHPTPAPPERRAGRCPGPVN